MKKLAIVIPAYKADFFEETLRSVSRQDSDLFRLYIGDDCSPDNLEPIFEKFSNRMDAIYKRFESNLGGHSLVKHWERCISMVGDEEFVWLFSDDDLMPPDAVSRIIESTNNNSETDIFRFNLSFIDESGKLIREPEPHPEFESSREFIIRRLHFNAISAGCEYIFRKEVFLKNEGFVEFPLAWCSDDATWSLIGMERGIRTIPGKRVEMRMSSGINISTNASLNRIKFKSVILFSQWIKKQFQSRIDKKSIYRYLRSQINALNINFWFRFRNVFSLFTITGLVYTCALLLNLSRFYKITDAAVGIRKIS